MRCTFEVRRTFWLIWLVLLLVGCQAAENYPSPDSPLFTGSYATPPANTELASDAELRVITWNIQFAEKIDQAIAEFQEVAGLQDADILLLQEMDETAVEQIAQTLGYNYVYFPASVHPQNDKNFGNAILAKWPISDPAKLLLPYENPTNQQMRIATRAVVTIGEREVLVYSVHTETIWLDEGKRLEQVETIVNDIDDGVDWVIVGGDFNTTSEAEVTAVTDLFADIELERVSTDAEPTVEKAGLGFTADHIFARGFIVQDNGVWVETAASDHFPVWVELVWEK